MVGHNLLRFKSDQIYNAFDFETEGLNCHYSRPWQLSYTIFRLNEILDKKTYYIWFPDLKVSVRAAQITGFDYNKYKSLAISPQEVFNDIYNNLRLSLGLDEDNVYLNKAIDTLALAISYKNNIKPYGDFFTWQYRMLSNRTKGTSLSAMAKELGISIDETKLHEASNDTDILVEILKKFIWSMEI